MKRPRMFITAEKMDGLRSLEEVRNNIVEGHAAQLWNELLKKVDREKAQDAWTPKTPLPQRSAKQIKHANREYELVALTAHRILDASLVALIKNDRTYADAALQQIEAIFDEIHWPEIEDITHLAHGDHCSLRSGQLSLVLGVTYDWLHNLLTPDERTWYLERFDSRFTQAFRAALKAGDRWVNWQQNFISVIYGGFGIAGMAFGSDYSESQWLVDTCKKKMDDYINTLFGREGEFNESVQYAGSAAHIVHYLMAEHYTNNGQTQPFTHHAFDDFCRWYMHATFPPGRVAGFGDPSPDMPPVVFHFSAVASVLRDSVFQWFYLQYADKTPDTHRKHALELLYFDPSLQAESPNGKLPLGRAYHEQAKLVSSRSSWDANETVSVAYGKAAREYNHSHADWGQLCLDGYGERLLLDLGSPPGYPKTHRERYYNYQQWGHNIFVFGQNETGGVSLAQRDLQGHISSSEFDDSRGGTWTMDLSAVYGDAHSVTRTVVHLLPRIVVVLDNAKLKADIPISMRWHTMSPPDLKPNGVFVAHGKHATLSGRIERLDGDVEIQTDQHAYKTPYHQDALGEPYTQRYESFVGASMISDRCSLISLFCVFNASHTSTVWQPGNGHWKIDTPEGLVQVTVKNGQLTVQNTDTKQQWP